MGQRREARRWRVGLLDGKKAIVMGVGNQRSIAWGIATAFQREGADLAFNYATERLRENVEKLVATLPGHERMPIMPCDVTKQEEIDAFFAKIGQEWGTADILVHSMAFAAVEDLRGRFHEISRDGLKLAIDVSAFSLIAITKAALPLFQKAGGGSVMSLTFNAVDRVVPSYNSMAMAKAVLEAATRYLAADLGPSNIRVNAISAGPLKTLAGSAVKGISAARDLMEEKAPLRRNVTQEEVGNVAVFLASELSRCVTGATIFADNGFNVLGWPTNLRVAARSRPSSQRSGSRGHRSVPASLRSLSSCWYGSPGSPSPEPTRGRGASAAVRYRDGDTRAGRR
jgi:enoyl-[acyl-carrier protein] reductase I